ncbi:MAG: TolB family protein [Acidobacteriota bacterium]
MVLGGGSSCVGCHAVARSGTEVAMGYGGETLQTISLPSLATGISAATQKIPMGWASYSPDGTRLVVANKGVLALYDAKTGAPIGAGGGKVPLPPMRFATHPDWSPDGAYVAVALTGVAPTNQDVSAASIARIPFHADTWGPTEVIVAATGSDNDYFPRYSPDGKYLAYVHATTAAHGAPDASLRLVPATGGTPIVLANAAGAADTMPSWAPQQNQRAWLAFASARAYGVVVPGGGPSQIWITAIDLAHAATSSDPSAGAFWLPSQDVTVLNNNPVWSPSPTP